MHRLGLFALVGIAACSDKYDPNPLDGIWRVERTAHNTTSGCSPLTLPPLMVRLHPGYEREIDLGAQDGGASGNAIAGNHITFTSAEVVGSDTFIVRHELEVQIHQSLLLGTATAKSSARPDCRWTMDAVASQTSH